MSASKTRKIGITILIIFLLIGLSWIGIHLFQLVFGLIFGLVALIGGLIGYYIGFVVGFTKAKKIKLTKE